MNLLFLYTFLLWTPPFPGIVVHNDTLTGRVIKIVDGDTFDVLVDQTTLRIRMNAIDCPERRQDYYQVAKDSLAAFIFGRTIRLVPHGKDRYTRTIADIYFEDHYINLEMISKGLAWHYKKYSSNLRMAEAETEARISRAGLWKLKNPVAPWEFRKLRKKINRNF